MKQTFFAFGIFTVFIILFFHPVVFSGKCLAPVDLLYYYPPYDFYRPAAFTMPSNWILFDEILEFYPWRHFAKDQLSRGLIPLWNRFNFCGHPFLALLQTGVFYPVYWILYLFEDSVQPGLSAIIHTYIACLGMFFLLRWWKIGFAGAIAGSIAFGWCGFQVVWMGHPHSKVGAWLPWIFWLADRSALMRCRASIVGLFGVVMLQFGAGHYETSLHIFLALSVFFLFRWGWFVHAFTDFRKYLAKGALVVIVVIILAVLGTCVQSFPFAEYLYRSSAYDARKEGVWVKPYLSPSLMVCQIIPKIFGTNADNNYWWQDEGREAGNTNEINAGYVGIVALYLALAGLFSKIHPSIKRGLITILIISLGVSYGWPLIYEGVHLLPLFKMSYNFRFLLLSAFVLAVLCGCGIEKLSHDLSRKELRALFGLVLLFLGLSFAIGGAAFSTALRHFPSGSMYQYLLNQYFIFLSFSLVSIILIVAKGAGRLSFTGFTSLAVSLVFIDLYLFGSYLNPSFDSKYCFPDIGMLQFLKKAPEPSRTFPVGYIAPAHLSMLDDWDDPRGNDALTPYWEERYMALIDPEILAPYVLPALRLIQVRKGDSPLADTIGGRFLIQDLRRALPTNPKFWLVYEKDCRIFDSRNANTLATIYYASTTYTKLPAMEQDLGFGVSDPCQRLFVLGDEVKTVSSGLRSEPAEILRWDNHCVSVRVDTGEDGWLFVPITHFPGWEAKVDGQEVAIRRAQLAFMAMPVEEGRHEVTLTYRPFSYRFGLFVSLWAFVGLGLTAAFHKKGQ